MRLRHIIGSSFVPILVLGLAGRSGSHAKTSNRAADSNCRCSYDSQSPAHASNQTDNETGVLHLQGSMSRVHDPVMTKEGGTYYLFSTGRGITVHTSKDMITWEQHGRVFEQKIPWTSETIPGSTDYYWAPDISFFNGKWHLYYSVSTFGKNRSAIGLATNATLDRTRPDYRWNDEGLVIESKLSDDWNAIDPNIALDEKKQPWLSAGSFWSGVKLIKLDRKTGKPANTPHELVSLAGRERGGAIKGAIEAPFIVHRKGFYYLFVSFDLCCRGTASTYNIRVGRSSKITGPYSDRDGKPMMEGGGTLLVSSSQRWRGPGHNAVFHENGADWLVYHAYDAEAFGAPKLRIEKLNWSSNGWPETPSMPTIEQR